ncbi:MAG: hypothetical protein U9N87_07640 [Planctomycetota bacterium]|nr:hypothetical protein [Planctomycetota bacterium]
MRGFIQKNSGKLLTPDAITGIPVIEGITHIAEGVAFSSGSLRP